MLTNIASQYCKEMVQRSPEALVWSCTLSRLRTWGQSQLHTCDLGPHRCSLRWSWSWWLLCASSMMSCASLMRSTSGWSMMGSSTLASVSQACCSIRWTPEQGLSPSWEQPRPGDQALGLWDCALV